MICLEPMKPVSDIYGILHRAANFITEFQMIRREILETRRKVSHVEVILWH